MIRDMLEVSGVFAIAGVLTICAFFVAVLLFGVGYDHAVHSDERDNICFDLGLANGEHVNDCFDLSPKEVRMLQVENRDGAPALTSGLTQLRGGVLTYKRIGDIK